MIEIKYSMFELYLMASGTLIVINFITMAYCEHKRKWDNLYRKVMEKDNG